MQLDITELYLDCERGRLLATYLGMSSHERWVDCLGGLPGLCCRYHLHEQDVSTVRAEATVWARKRLSW